MTSGNLWPQNFFYGGISTTPWGIVFQLQGFPLNHSASPCGCQLQVYVGVNGSSFDAQILNWLEMRSSIIESTLQVPAAGPLHSDECPMPYFLIGEDAFYIACG